MRGTYEPFVVKTTGRRAVELPGGDCRLVVISDTHSAPHPRTVELVAKEAPVAILHAGDIGDLGVLETFAPIAPVLAIRGNIDVAGATEGDDGARVPDALAIDLTERGEPLLRLYLQHICLRGPKLLKDARERAHAQKARVVVCGHSHVPFLGSDGDLVVFNPGSCGPRRMNLPIVFGVMELRARKLSMKHVSCETGEDWRPFA